MIDTKDFNNPSLDSESRRQLLTQKIIELENRISGFEAVFKNISARLDGQGSVISDMYGRFTALEMQDFVAQLDIYSTRLRKLENKKWSWFK